MRFRIFGLGMAGICLCSSYSFADVPSINPRPRMLSMGGAGVATLGDKDSAMMNPAGLADVEKGVWEFVPPLIEVPFAWDEYNAATNYKDAIDASGATTSEKQKALETFLRQVATTSEAVRVNLYPSYTRRYFHIGVLADLYMDPKLRLGGLTSNEAFDLGNANGTIGIIVGGAYGVFDNNLEFGLTLKPLYRMDLTRYDEQTAHDILLSGNDSVTGEDGKPQKPTIKNQIFGDTLLENRGFGVGVDLGVKYKLPYLQDILQPAVGVTWQDVGDTRFFGDHDRPTPIPQSLSAGIAIHPDWKFIRNTVTFDLRNINKEEEILNKIHFGVESVLFRFLAIRGGLSQGYITAGLGVDLKFFETDVYLSARESANYNNIEPTRTIGLRLAAAL